MTFGFEKIESVTEPDPRTAANYILNGISAEDMITVHTKCSTEYSGRAEGGIDEGERLLVLKPKSGTFLVHGDEGYKPINWQSSGATLSADITDEGNLLLSAETNESLVVTCTKIYELTVFNNKDTATLELNGTEKEMHNRILETPSLIETGLHSLRHEKEFPFGRVDIFARDTDETPVIIEVKRRPATRDHVYQLYTYVLDYTEKYDESVRGILVAPKCTEYILETLHSYDLEFEKVNAVA